MRVAVVWNPTGGRGASARLRGVAEREFQRLGVHAVWVATTEPGTGASLAAEFVRQGEKVVVAAGGDGTVSQVATGLVGKGTAMAVLPFGTGNDLCRCLGIGTDVREACRAIAEERTEPVDVGHWSTVDAEGVFVNVAGCGFDGDVAHRINTEFRWAKGRTAYLLAILKSLRRYRPVQVAMTVDGQEHVGPVMLCAVANATSYGGGLRIAPAASLTDGLLDVVRVGAVGKLEFLRNFPRLMRGQHLDHPRVRHMHGHSVSIQTDPPVPLLVDGELVPGGAASIEVIPRALRLVVPAKLVL